MELIDRFKYIMKLNNLTASAFADEIGVQRSSISHILSGRNKPSLEFIQKVLTKYPKVSADWLIAGITATEKMELPTIESNNEASERKAPLSSPTTSNQKSSTRSITKMVVFYNDNTFEEFFPG
jgi:transcriptional regulator with XRE-family HTH domain